MSEENKNRIDELAEILRALADVWPNDRENVMVAGAKFEETIDGLSKKGVQLEKLINLAWEGLKHLYEEDDYFISVKTATMNGVNTVREYILSEGDIPVEDFERACDLLEKALSGGGESADEVIKLEELEGVEPGNDLESTRDGPDKASGRISLDDLASAIMMLSEETVSDDEIGGLVKSLQEVIDHSDKSVKSELEEALQKAEEVSSDSSERKTGWLKFISDQIESAIEKETDEESNDSGCSAEQDGTEEEIDRSDNRENLQENGEEPVFTIPKDTEMGMLSEFITECTDLIETAERALLDLEDSPGDEELINTVFRAFHTVKGTSAFMGFDPVSDFTHSVETLLSMVREGDLEFDRASADITFDSIDILKKLLNVIGGSTGGDPLPTSAAYHRMMRVLSQVCDKGVSPEEALENESAANKASEAETDANTVDPKSIASKPGKNGTPENNASANEGESTVRVNVSRLDRLIDMVGELVIAHSVVAQDNSMPKDSHLMKKVNHTTKILRELQDTSLTLRMVPLKATFHKMNRLVRDLARKAGKKVKFLTMGEDTEIDRNMVDVINEPLVHMLRNSLDHGIETPEERANNDKSETAEIWLRAYQEGGKVIIEIEDDGKGIDKEKVLNKAIEKGLVDPEDKLTESEILHLIFLPGFSSADEVTDLSGRGVGMDVVRRSIEQLQGKVEVSSEMGKGTKISIELPFTLAITDGMLVKVGDQKFIIPTMNIETTFRVEEKDLYTMMGDTEQVLYRGKSVPVIRLHKQFDIEDAIEDLTEGTLLIISNDNKRYAMLLDEVLGQQQLVGKSINMITKMPHVSGGAILGDGRVGLILDTTAIVK